MERRDMTYFNFNLSSTNFTYFIGQPNINNRVTTILNRIILYYIKKLVTKY